MSFKSILSQINHEILIIKLRDQMRKETIIDQTCYHEKYNNYLYIKF